MVKWLRKKFHLKKRKFDSEAFADKRLKCRQLFTFTRAINKWTLHLQGFRKIDEIRILLSIKHSYAITRLTIRILCLVYALSVIYLNIVVWMFMTLFFKAIGNGLAGSMRKNDFNLFDLNFVFRLIVLISFFSLFIESFNLANFEMISNVCDCANLRVGWRNSEK